LNSRNPGTSSFEELAEMIKRVSFPKLGIGGILAEIAESVNELFAVEKVFPLRSAIVVRR